MRMVSIVVVVAGLGLACKAQEAPSDDSDSDSEPASRWPTNPDKEALGDPESSAALIGEPVPRLRTQDQFGDPVDLYDFSGSDVPIVLQLVYLDDDVSVDLAELLAGQGGDLDSPPLSGLPTAVESSELLYVRVMSVRPTSQGGAATASDIADWRERFPQDRSPLLLDDEGLIYNWVQSYWVTSGAQPVLRPEILQVRPQTMTVSRPAKDHLQILEDLLGG